MQEEQEHRAAERPAGGCGRSCANRRQSIGEPERVRRVSTGDSREPAVHGAVRQNRNDSF